MPLPGMGGAAPSNNMMLEMQLKMAQRAEKASFATGAAKSEIEQRQKQLIAQGQQVTRSSKLDGGVGAELADGSKAGALFAQRRVRRRCWPRTAVSSNLYPCISYRETDFAATSGSLVGVVRGLALRCTPGALVHSLLGHRP